MLLNLALLVALILSKLVYLIGYAFLQWLQLLLKEGLSELVKLFVNGLEAALVH